MAVRLVGYANWYYKHRVKSGPRFVRGLVEASLIDLQSGSLHPSEVHWYDAAQAELHVSALLHYYANVEPALHSRLIGDLGYITNSGQQMKMVVIRRWKLVRSIKVSLASYQAGGDERVFWIRVQKKWLIASR